MKFIVRSLLATALLATASLPAFGHDGRFGARVYIGDPFFSPWYSPYPYSYPYPGRYYDARPVIITPLAPPPPSDVIVDSATGPRQYPSYRNYCTASGAWFPQVKACADGWQLR
jgi:hypothetical protein